LRKTEEQTAGIVDAASVDSIVTCMARVGPVQAGVWAWTGSVESTTALLLNRTLAFAPSPEYSGGQTGPFEALRRSLAPFLSDAFPAEQKRQEALRKTKAWTRKHAERIAVEFSKLMADANCRQWLESEVELQWENHSQASNGLFNETLVPEISSVLNIPLEELRRLLILSRDRETVRQYCKTTDGADFHTTCDSYVLAALLRGVYHDYLARDRRQQILHHQLRRNPRLLPKVLRKPRMIVPIPNTAEYLARIILGSAAREAKSKRIQAYSHYLANGREAHFRESIDLSHKTYDSAAKDAAVAAARRLGIHTVPQVAYRLIDLAAAAGIGVITSFFVDPFWSLTIGGGSYVASLHKDVGERIGEAALDTRKRVTRLADLGPGRIGSSADTDSPGGE